MSDNQLETNKKLVKELEKLEGSITENTSSDDISKKIEETFEFGISPERWNRCLQLCCEKNLLKSAKAFVQNGADVLGVSQDVNNISCLEIACQRGKAELIEILLNTLTDTNFRPDVSQSKAICASLCRLIKRISCQLNEKSFEENLKLLLKIIKNTNMDTERWTDAYGNTPILYATYCDLPESPLFLLLDTVLLVNSRTRTIDNMNQAMLEKYLDKCVTVSVKTLEIDYSALCPEKKPEAAVFSTICAREKFRNLILHPVVLCFLHLKWNILHKVFFWGTVVYWTILILLLSICSVNNNDKLKWISFALSLVQFVSVIVALKIFRHTLKREIFKTLFISIGTPVAILIVTISNFDEYTSKIFLSTVLMVLPLKVISLLKVEFDTLFEIIAWNFFKLMLKYVIIFFPLTVSYFVIFYNPPSDIEWSEYFTNFTLSAHNVFTLFKGTLTFPKNDSVLEKVYSIYFIFICVFVPMNLFTAVAVTLIEEQVKDDMKLVCVKEKIKFIYHVENLIKILFVKCNKCFQKLRICRNLAIFQEGKKIQGIINEKTPRSKHVKANEQIIEGLNNLQKRKEKQANIVFCALKVVKETTTASLDCEGGNPDESRSFLNSI